MRVDSATCTIKKDIQVQVCTPLQVKKAGPTL